VIKLLSGGLFQDFSLNCITSFGKFVRRPRYVGRVFDFSTYLQTSPETSYFSSTTGSIPPLDKTLAVESPAAPAPITAILGDDEAVMALAFDTKQQSKIHFKEKGG
jgi:hypothetical protein